MMSSKDSSWKWETSLPSFSFTSIKNSPLGKYVVWSVSVQEDSETGGGMVAGKTGEVVRWPGAPGSGRG